MPVAWPGAEVGYLKHRLHSRHHVQDTLGTIAGTRTFNCKRHVKVDNIESGTQTAELKLGTDYHRYLDFNNSENSETLEQFCFAKLQTWMQMTECCWTCASSLHLFASVSDDYLITLLQV